MAGMIGSIAGLGMQGFGFMQQRKQQKRQQQAARQMAEINAQINNVYGVQAKLEYNRRSTEIFREQQRARSESLATTTNQGAAGKGGSALPGAYGQIGGQVNNELMKNSQNFMMYQDLQKLYNQMLQVQAMSGQASSNIGSMGSFSSFAGQLSRIMPAFGQLGLLGGNGGN